MGTNNKKQQQPARPTPLDSLAPNHVLVSPHATVPQQAHVKANKKKPPPPVPLAKWSKKLSVSDASTTSIQKLAEASGDGNPCKQQQVPKATTRTSQALIPADQQRPALKARSSSDSIEARPALPPRREMSTGINLQVSSHQSTPIRPSALSMGFSAATPSGTSSTTSQTSSPRHQSPIRPGHPAPALLSAPSALQATETLQDPSRAPPKSSQAAPKLPAVSQRGFAVQPNHSERDRLLANGTDMSQINRRAPFFPGKPQSIPMGYDARSIAVCGSLVCTAGALVRVWDCTNGRLLLSMSLGEQVKATAVAFKPSRQIEDDGTTLWIGTDWGELMEIDIASKRVNKSNTTAHARREIIRILQHNLDLWTIDDEGKLWAWPSAATWPDLDMGVQNARLPRRPSATLVVGNKLWVANGREIRVFEPTSDPQKAAILHTQQPLTQPLAGEITCGAILLGDVDSQVYFGHNDGKISVYSQRAPLECIALLNISPYKINCMLGVGGLLWAGFSMGHIFVYDPAETGWRIKKEWRKHTGPVIGIVSDPNSSWKTGELQVVSLGSDETIGIWDGMLKADWLDEYMVRHQAEYAVYQDVSAMIFTWNAGAAKPSDLKRNDGRDSRFFRELVASSGTPDILVFSLQELVDLEDKRLTAKTLLKGRSKDAYGQEHLSTAYRAWRDYLTWTLDECMSPKDGYFLLHTASLVGLFTCVFVKATFRNRIHGLGATEVKTGMGGLHGNKGALLVRFLLDDSSLCFVNCHLAAGQTHTQHRNNDVTTILESSSLPVLRLATGQTEILTSGGDGTMILDHEICILHGDLNYRIDTIPRESVIAAVRSRNYSKLLERDQLLLVHRKNPGFRLRAFTEGAIDFAPTYKYDVGSDEYDTGEKRRVPAWCDRILWRGGKQVQQQTYERHDELRTSDHRPVSSHFNFRIKSIDSGARTLQRQQAEQEFERRSSQVSESAK